MIEPEVAFADLDDVAQLAEARIKEAQAISVKQDRYAALDQLKEEGIVDLDDEKRAAMVSNLLVVLCSDKHTQPVVNTGSLYN